MTGEYRKVAIIDSCAEDVGVYWADEDENLYEAEWPSDLPETVNPADLRARGFEVIVA